MESPGFITLLYIMWTLPEKLDLKTPLPWTNWAMAALFTIHYLNRALISPLILNPSMSPIHPLVCLMAAGFQLANSISIGGWLAGYGPMSQHQASSRMPYVILGFVIWFIGFILNIRCDDQLREIRRKASRKQKARAEKEKKSINTIDKVYELPSGELFDYCLDPHYFTEWVEWLGFWIIGGANCFPAQYFLMNEISTMLPSALRGKRWYIDKFGNDKVGSRTAVVPGII
jgi:3-oxo-5-alpha-steroid 4-dehydrogenase 1